MTSEATAGQIEDVYGQVHPVETPDLISRKRKEFDLELDKIPTADKVNVLKAQSQCPNLLTDDFILKFLRCEVFNADLAAKRYVKYWNKRVEIFGEDRAFKPLTLSGALKDDDVPFSLGVMTLLPSKDPSGRSIIVYDPSKLDKTKYDTPQSIVRTYWYVIHAALENRDCEKKGLIMIGDTQATKFRQFDRTVSKYLLASMQGAIPVRSSAFHLVKPPTFFHIIYGFLKVFMSERMRKRILLHSGSHEKTLKKLEEHYGLTADMLPTEIGGNLKVDHMGWLQQRREKGL
eukprot:CAMPEP_0194216944 /NCGR_PEP_ID=MMETSP0156-20130528/20050_1 /TAXON_ID=33649 /ORGANISM="Thalassionema nitzschioides, Strain L26-B" /LENGTH=288 /DNA_ID=CAMNT_0038945835 /DNA_START=51 /DNA_END=917 /DNA_ORIENTATION=-